METNTFRRILTIGTHALIVRANGIGINKRKVIMPQTITETYEGRIIAGIFSNRENAGRAVLAFRELNIPEKNIQQVVQSDEKQAVDGDTSLVEGRGFSKAQAVYYANALRAGKILVAVYEVDESAPIIDIFNKHKAEYNPNGSRNVRDDVLGMTATAIAGAAVGAAVGGPAGVVAGAIIGGSFGAAAGKAVEHRK
jgi:hypothetical protein